MTGRDAARVERVLLIGSTILNQDPTHPMSGVIIATPRGQAEPDGWIWVRWANGLVCQEYPADVTLTAGLRQWTAERREPHA
jgi:hypothetical protein